MKRILFIWLAFLFPALSASTIPDAIEAAKPSIVGIGTQLPTRRPPAQLRGTGFVVADGKHVITNHHVVPKTLDQEKHEVLVVFVGSGEAASIRTARVVALDEAHDLALLRVDGEALPSLTVAKDSRVREGESMLITGFPIGAVLGLYPASNLAMVSAITPVVIPSDSARQLNAVSIKRLQAPYLVYQLDAIAYPGNSGSPVYRPETGEVVGVVNSVLVKETKEAALSAPSAITYAIPAEFVLELLTRAGVQP